MIMPQNEFCLPDLPLWYHLTQGLSLRFQIAFRFTRLRMEMIRPAPIRSRCHLTVACRASHILRHPLQIEF